MISFSIVESKPFLSRFPFPLLKHPLPLLFIPLSLSSSLWFPPAHHPHAHPPTHHLSPFAHPRSTHPNIAWHIDCHLDLPSLATQSTLLAVSWPELFPWYESWPQFFSRPSSPSHSSLWGLILVGSNYLFFYFFRELHRVDLSYLQLPD